MIFGKITRFPFMDFPKEVVTGKPSLDRFLKELDKQLLGNAKVRLLFLSEIKDHILEKQDYLISKGDSEAASMEKAIQSMGPPKELAAAQKKELLKKFVWIALFCGIPFGIFTGLFDGFNAPFITIRFGHVIIVFNSLFRGIFFGLVMGWFIVFFWPERQLSPVSRTSGSTDEKNEFTVHYNNWLKILSYPLTVLFLALSAYCIFFGTAGYFFPSMDDLFLFPWWKALGLGILGVIDFYFIKIGSRNYRVSEDCVYLTEFFGRKKTFMLKNLKKSGRLGDRWRWVPMYWKKVKFAEFENNNKIKRMFIYPDMVNADRLFVLINNRVNS